MGLSVGANLNSSGSLLRFQTGDEEDMPHYIALGKWTEEGIRGVKEAPKRVETVRRMAQRLGGNFQLYFTMGEYDTVSIVEMPNDEAYNKFALWLGGQGNVRTRTLKAWTADEAARIFAEIPQ